MADTVLAIVVPGKHGRPRVLMIVEDASEGNEIVAGMAGNGHRASLVRMPAPDEDEDGDSRLDRLRGTEGGRAS